MKTLTVGTSVPGTDPMLLTWRGALDTCDMPARPREAGEMAEGRCGNI